MPTGAAAWSTPDGAAHVAATVGADQQVRRGILSTREGGPHERAVTPGEGVPVELEQVPGPGDLRRQHPRIVGPDARMGDEDMARAVVVGMPGGSPDEHEPPAGVRTPAVELGTELRAEV